MTGAAVPFAGLYVASASDLAKSLPEIGDGLRAQFQSLQQHPSAHAAEALAANLDGARQTVLRLREQLLRGNA